MEEEVFSHGRTGDQAAEAVVGREQEAETARRRSVAGQIDASGRSQEMYGPPCGCKDLMLVSVVRLSDSVSGLSRVNCCCSQALTRSVHAAPE